MNTLEQNQIYVAGIGASTPLGANAQENWNAALLKRVAPRPIPTSRFDVSQISCGVAGLLPAAGRDWTAAVLSACEEALAQSQLDPSGVGLITGSNFGSLDAGAQALAGELPPESLKLCNHSQVACYLSEKLKLGGPVASISLSCSSGASIIAAAADWLAARKTTAVLAVGFDYLSLCAWSGLCALRTMSRKGVVRPFSSERDGTIFAEGAAAVLLTTRPAIDSDIPSILLSGWATGNNGFHLTAPPARASGSAQVMRGAIDSAGLALDDLAFLTAHATGTKANDFTEAQAIYDTFETCAEDIPVAAFKAAFGHLLGAAGAFEAVMTVMALKNGVVPPIASAPTPDPELPPLKIVTEATSIPENKEFALTNSAGFGGCNASLVFRKTSNKTSATAASSSLCTTAKRNVAIFATGFISALGIGDEEATAALEEGECACFPSSRLSRPSEAASNIVGEIPDFDPSVLLPSAKAFLDRHSLLALSASALALRKPAGQILLQKTPHSRAGVSFGSSWGAVETLQRFYDDCLNKGPRLVKPMLFPHTYANTAASLISIEWELRGTHMNFAGGANASAFALISAVQAIKAGQVDVMLSGGAEALSAVRWQAEASCNGPSAPTLGEGAALFLLADESRAAIRPIARILGIGISGNGVRNPVQSAIDSALCDARLRPTDIETAYAPPRIPLPLPAGFKWTIPEALTGFCDGATMAIQLACALLTAHTTPILCVSHDDTGSATAIIAHRLG